MAGWEERRGSGRWVPYSLGWTGLYESGEGVLGGLCHNLLLVRQLCFFIPLLLEKLPSAQTPGPLKALLNHPQLVLQGKDKCCNAHEDNGNLIHHHKSAQASLPRVLSRHPSPLRSQQCPIMLPETVCCPCLSPIDRTDTLLPDSTSCLSCSNPENLARRSKIQGGAGNRARLAALGSPCDPHAPIYHLPPSAGPRAWALFPLHAA